MKKLKLFDFDGVLFDSVQAQYQASCTVIRQFGLQPKTFWSYVHSEHIFDWFREHGIDLSDDQLRILFFTYYDTSLCGLLDGVPETLDSLLVEGFSLVIVSANPLEDTSKKLARFGIAEAFTNVYGSCYKKADTLREVCTEFGALPCDVFFTGDMYSDLHCGRKAGVRTVYIGHEESPYTHVADHHITHISQLLEVVK